MEWKELSREASSDLFDEYCHTEQPTCPETYAKLRDEILKLFVCTLSEIGIDPEDINNKGNNYAYQVDCKFGLKLYQLLNDNYNMTIRTASSEDVWRFLSVCVVPDLVQMRYGLDHPDRFWKKPKRIWLRVLWWYIHLSWQGDEESTFMVIKDNSTDEILQLVDRCGRDGFRIDLYREIMKQYAYMDISERRKERVFRRMMVLNTAKVQTIEPALVDGGEVQYVDDLCRYFGYELE